VAADCSICLGMFGDNTLRRTLPCMHSFHLTCINLWTAVRRVYSCFVLDIQRLSGKLC